MDLEYAPLLKVQRDLYQMPRGFERFREYLRTMIDAQSGDLKLPLVAMNPMGKDHVPAFLDACSPGRGRRSSARGRRGAQADRGKRRARSRCAAVVSDDSFGGWTNRHTSELGHRFHEAAFYKRGWITAVLWTSETYTAGVGPRRSARMHPSRLHPAPRCDTHAARHARARGAGDVDGRSDGTSFSIAMICVHTRCARGAPRQDGSGNCDRGAGDRSGACARPSCTRPVGAGWTCACPSRCARLPSESPDHHSGPS